MTRTRIAQALLGASLLVLPIGCSSAPTPSEERKTEASPRDDAKAPDELPPRAKTSRRHIPAGHVQFKVRNADLKSEVLPIFYRQAGVRILWKGDSRSVRRLSFPRPIRWQDAMSLVCQFTKTHLARDYQGRLILKDGWSGQGSTQAVDIKGGKKGGKGRRYTGAGTPRAGGAVSTSSSTRSKGKAGWNESYGTKNKSGAGDTARRLLKGTTNRRSGGR